MDDERFFPASAAKFIGRYQILEALESGGMGTIYRAFDPRLETEVCIKQIKEGPGSVEFHKRWLPEVRAIAQLRHHPNIVNIYDASEAEFGRPTIVMEFIRGKTVQRMIRDGDPIGLATRLDYMQQLAAGLGYAHSKNIVHRDIKPANLMVDQAGVLKILDFGIARMSSGTTASAVVGTMNYMAPEQWGRDPVDARSDIFSVGAVFYEILCGRRAFAGDTVAEVYPLILSGHPAPLEDVCPELEPEVVRIVNRMLEKRPADRYQSLEPVQREIERIRARLTPAAEELFNRTSRWERRDVPDPIATPHSPTPGRIIDRESVARRRAVKIDTAINAAQQAFADGRYEEVLHACGQALELDPEHAVALDLLERARTTLQVAEARQLAAGARHHFARGELQQALRSIQAALALLPNDADLIAVRDQIVQAETEQARGRAQRTAIQNAMSDVRAAIDEGDLDQARRQIDLVLSLDGAQDEALRLRSLVHRLVDEREQRAAAEKRRPTEYETVALSPDHAPVVQESQRSHVQSAPGSKLKPQADTPTERHASIEASTMDAQGAATRVDQIQTPPRPIRPKGSWRVAAGAALAMVAVGAGLVIWRYGESSLSAPSSVPIAATSSVLAAVSPSQNPAVHPESSTTLPQPPSAPPSVTATIDGRLLAAALADLRAAKRDAIRGGTSITTSRQFLMAVATERDAAVLQRSHNPKTIDLLRTAASQYEAAARMQPPSASDAGGKPNVGGVPPPAAPPPNQVDSQSRDESKPDPQAGSSPGTVAGPVGAAAVTPSERVPERPLDPKAEEPRPRPDPSTEARGVTAPPPTPPPSVSPAVGINDALSRYRQAYQAMDVDALLKIYPRFAGAQELRKKFSDLREVAMALGNAAITQRSDGTAIATCTYSLTFTSRTGRIENTKPLRAEFTLRQVGVEWTIESHKFK